MIRALVIVPDRELRDGLLASLRAEGRNTLQPVIIQGTFDQYLEEDDLRQALEQSLPQVVFFDAATNLDAALVAARVLRERASTFLVAVHRVCEPQVLIRLMHAGVREAWHLPFEASTILESLERLRDALRDQAGSIESTSRVHAFLPAKPGCGTSTIAVNTALALARAEQRRVLLADFDLQEGIAKFLLKLGTAFTAVDALEKVTQLDEALWGELVAKTNQIDVLTSGPVAARVPYSAGRVRRLIEFMRCGYATTLLDLPGRLDELTLEALEESNRILVVCTPDLPALFLAREKVKYLENAGLGGRVGLLLNRWTKQAPVTIADIESLLGLPVQQSIRDDADEVWQAILKGGGAAPLSPLGGEYAVLAQSLSEMPVARPVTPKKRMVEYFTLSPGRYTLPQGRG